MLGLFEPVPLYRLPLRPQSQPVYSTTQLVRNMSKTPNEGIVNVVWKSAPVHGTFRTFTNLGLKTDVVLARWSGDRRFCCHESHLRVLRSIAVKPRNVVSRDSVVCPIGQVSMFNYTNTNMK
jgi:hypothetical protein